MLSSHTIPGKRLFQRQEDEMSRSEKFINPLKFTIILNLLSFVLIEVIDIQVFYPESKYFVCFIVKIGNGIWT